MRNSAPAAVPAGRNTTQISFPDLDFEQIKARISASEDLLKSQAFTQRLELYKWLRGKSMDPLLQFTPEGEPDAERQAEAEEEAEGDLV